VIDLIVSVIGSLVALLVIGAVSWLNGVYRAKSAEWQERLSQDPSLRLRTALRCVVYLVIGASFFVVSIVFAFGFGILDVLGVQAEVLGLATLELIYWTGAILGVASVLMLAAGMFSAASLSSVAIRTR